jgi:hypothetical protein
LFTRYLAIVLAFGAAVLQGSRGNWVETAGLVGLGAGLVLLRLSTPDPFAATRARPGAPPPSPALRWLAWGCFAVTLVAFIAVARRSM